jgi:hypothetical protein
MKVSSNPKRVIVKGFMTFESMDLKINVTFMKIVLEPLSLFKSK